MSAAEYRKVSRVPPFTAGQARVFEKDVAFSNTEGFIHSLREIFLDEVYRFATDDQRPLIVDAGANIGLSIIYFKQLFPACKIIAFEPDPAIFKLLERNVHERNLNDVDLRNAAVWIADTQLTFYSEGSLAGSTEVDFLAKGDTRMVKAERLKSVIQDKHVTFLKLDIEGAENSVIFDIAPDLDRVERLFFEYHSIPGKEQRLGDLLNVVTRAGFKYVINGAHGARLPFIERTSQGFDLQLNVSCFRN